MVSLSDTEYERPAWFVAAQTTGSYDQTERFVRDGIWENATRKSDDYSALVNSIQTGDRIAIKSEYNRNELESLPFDNGGEKVRSMTIKATGIVIANPNDGRTLKVDWTPVAELRKWYFYTLAKPVNRVPPDRPKRDKEWQYKALNSFAFENEPQNIDRFLNSPPWSNKYRSVTPTVRILERRTGLEPPSPVKPSSTYTINNIIADGCFLTRSTLEAMLQRLQDKRNIILQGPPGTGKTWLAKKLAYALIGRKDDHRVRPMQFHPNLSYEDFVRGWRPQGNGQLALVDGPFLQVVEDARKNPDNDYVMVIEEINRGNPASIFGEMLTLLEADKRNADEALALAYPREIRERVHIPPNVYVIGTMNLADRSLAMVDLALRRRFAFFDLEPMLNETWRDWVHTECGVPSDFLEDIARRIDSLNGEIAGDRNLGRQFRIGHSFVTPAAGASIGDPQEWFTQVVETEIVPLLHEYWFDDPDRVADARSKLLNAL